MLDHLRARRTTLAPLTAGIFALALLMAGGAGSAHASDPVPADDPHGHHQHDPVSHGADHHAGHDDGDEHDGHGSHDCDVCLCYAAAGPCSAPALGAEISPPAPAPILLKRGLAAPGFAPDTSLPDDIFHPPQG